MKPIVSASIMCADLLALGKEVSLLEKAGVDWLHIDVMDGHFVPNIVVGSPDLVKALKSQTKLPLDLHLMIGKPEKMIEAFAKAGLSQNDFLVFHFEATKNPKEVLAQIQKLGIKPGIALKPKTPVSVLKGLLDKVEMILLMTVNPGFAGQAFIEEVLPKIKKVKEMLKGRKLIQVDGGLTLERMKECARQGANVFVGGTSSIFNKPFGLRKNISQIIKKIHQMRINS